MSIITILLPLMANADAAITTNDTEHLAPIQVGFELTGQENPMGVITLTLPWQYTPIDDACLIPGNCSLEAQVGYGDFACENGFQRESLLYQGTDGLILEYSMNFSQVSSGGKFSCGLLSNSTPICWGDNNSHQLEVPPNILATQISAGKEHTCALLIDHTIECWGNNASGQLSSLVGPEVLPSPSDTYIQVSAGDAHTCAVLSDRSAKCWGSSANNRRNIDLDATNYKQIAAGARNTCGVFMNGSAACWGANVQHQVSDIPLASNFKQISMGDAYSCTVFTNGTVQCWGKDDDNQVNDTPSLIDAEEVTSGASFSCVLRTTGEVQCWGLASNNQTVSPVGVNFTQISSGSAHSCGVDINGVAVCWGSNNFGRNQIPQASAIVTIEDQLLTVEEICPLTDFTLHIDNFHNPLLCQNYTAILDFELFQD
jgi:alpha-tubulin suppressor-like RCC1 family protein